MMRFELGLERPEPKRAPISAATIADSYFLGGLIPLTPYLLSSRVDLAFQVSIVLTAIALLLFGAIKGRLTGLNIVLLTAPATLSSRAAHKKCAPTNAGRVGRWLSGR